MYQKVLPALNKIGSIEYCPVVFVDDTEGQEALVLEHMKQFGWKDALNKKEGLRYNKFDSQIKSCFVYITFSTASIFGWIHQT